MAKAKFTQKQQALIDELYEEWPDRILLNDKISGVSLVLTARSLEKRGVVEVMDDEYGDLYGTLDQEFLADMTRSRESEN